MRGCGLWCSGWGSPGSLSPCPRPPPHRGSGLSLPNLCSSSCQAEAGQPRVPAARGALALTAGHPNSSAPASDYSCTRHTVRGHSLPLRPACQPPGPMALSRWHLTTSTPWSFSSALSQAGRDCRCKVGDPRCHPIRAAGSYSWNGAKPWDVWKVPTAQLLWRCAATPPAPLTWRGQQGPARRLRANLAISLLGLDCPCSSLAPRPTMWENSGKGPRRWAGPSEKWRLNPRKAPGSPAPRALGLPHAHPPQASEARQGPPGQAGIRAEAKGRSLGSGPRRQPLGVSASTAQWAANLPEGTNGQPAPITWLPAWPGLTLPSSRANSWARRLLRRPHRQSLSQRGVLVLGVQALSRGPQEAGGG